MTDPPPIPTAANADHRPARPDTLRVATFNDVAITYHVVAAMIPITIIFTLLALAPAIFTFGASLLLLAVPFAAYHALRWYYTKYFATLECTLTKRHLYVAQGLITRRESAIPLDRITDMSMNQGPIQRRLDLEAMGVETAGQTSGAGGSLVNLVGIENSRDFRAAVLEQRDRITRADTTPTAAQPAAAPAAPAPAPPAAEPSPAIDDIRDTLRRIEQLLADR